MATKTILHVEGLAKHFGDKAVLRDVTFSVNKGEIVGFIGRNGSGKTTTIKMILGLLQKTAGTVTICGEKVEFGSGATARYVGYLPDVPEFYNYLRPDEYLRLSAKVSGISDDEINERIIELLQLVGLESRKKIGTFSRGMKQRLGIAQALIGRPKLLICDEPTSALDPMGRYELLEILQRIKHETTILFSTHILSDVERISDSIVVLDEGVVKYAGTVDELKKQHQANMVRITTASEEECKAIMRAFGDEAVQEADTVVRVTCADVSTDYGKMLKKIEASGVIAKTIELVEPDLEQLFMEMAG